MGGNMAMFKSPPMAHQMQAIERAWKRDAFGLFHEMGAGKTFTTINLAAARYAEGQIDRLLVVCPTALIDVWHNDYDGGQMKEHCPIPYEVQVMSAGYIPRWVTDDRLKVFVVGIEALSIKQGRAMKFAWAFTERGHHNAMMVVDESSRIKNHRSTRTKNVVLLGGRCKNRMALTGTPITQGIEDLYAQFQYLDAKVIACPSWTVFKNRYCLTIPVRGAPQGVEKIVGYQRMDELLNRIAPYVDVVTKKECMDLPDKIYEPNIVVKPSEEQLRIIRDLRASYAAEAADRTLTTTTALERMTRYQQIIGGSFPFQEEGQNEVIPIPGGNPKLEALEQVLEEIPRSAKVIIWARFRPEIQYIVRRLSDLYGPDSIREFHGGTARTERARFVADFQQDSSVRFFVSNQSTGGYGITLTAATYAIYYSNTFSYEDRSQSEDRCHRRGTVNHVTYINLEMDIKEDRMILLAVKQKRDLADLVTEKLQ